MGSLDVNGTSATQLPLRIAILECDTPLDQTRAKFGGYGGVFRQLLERSADALGYPGLSSKAGLDLKYFHVVNHPEVYPDFDDIDAILITGSRKYSVSTTISGLSELNIGYNSFDNDPWILNLVEFTKKCLKQDHVKIIGVCFGHQIVGRALGQRVDRGEGGWEVSVLPVELTDMAKNIFGISAGALKIYQMHRDIVYGYPKGVQELGSSVACQNQGMYEPGRLLTVQGHPEFTKEIVEEIVRTRHAMGIFSDALFESAIKRLEEHDDGVTVGQAFLRFLLEDL